MFHRTVLCVYSGAACDDRSFSPLDNSGYLVLRAALLKPALELLACKPVDLVVVSDELSSRDKETLVSCARNKFGIPVVMVCNPPESEPASENHSLRAASTEGDLSADRYVEAHAGAEGLLTAVMELLPKRMAAGSGQ